MIVNRIWHHLLGRGIVPSVDNFGSLGDRPTHAELLDYLAADFMANDWSLKTCIRQIVLSRTYQLSTSFHEQNNEIDPGNQWLWRQRRRRLTAEAIRDAMLLASGKLDRRAGGSAVAHLGEQAIQNAAGAKNEKRNAANFRRSLYLPIVRNDLPSMLTTFDFADPDVVTGARSVTTVPAQALFMMNSPFVKEQSQWISERSLELISQEDLQSETTSPQETSVRHEARLRSLYLLILGRIPTSAERNYLWESYPDLLSDDENTTSSAWRELCQVLLASTEFRFLD